jgi:site-specific DNA-adenine methylase
MDTYTGKKRTILYLLMVYCSFNGTVMNNRGEWYVSGICNNIYSRSGSHVFTTNYAEKIRNISKIIHSCKTYSKDYAVILKKADKGDFVFLDPPYIDINSYVFNYNNRDDISLTKLLKEMEILDKKGVKWMMTQVDTKEIKNIFKKYKIIEIQSDISGKKSTLRSSKKELIIKNY